MKSWGKLSYLFIIVSINSDVFWEDMMNLHWRIAYEIREMFRDRKVDRKATWTSQASFSRLANRSHFSSFFPFFRPCAPFARRKPRTKKLARNETLHHITLSHTYHIVGTAQVVEIRKYATRHEMFLSFRTSSPPWRLALPSFLVPVPSSSQSEELVIHWMGAPSCTLGAGFL